MALSYLVSTAGHAQAQNERYPHGVETIIQLIREGAEEFGDEKVVGFTSLRAGQDWQCDTYSFRELLDLSHHLATSLGSSGLEESKGRGVVCLLCPTGLDFLVAWIAFMTMGLGVVFVAPQCSPAAIQSLCNATSSAKLFYHPKYRALADQTSQLDTAIALGELPAVYDPLGKPALSPNQAQPLVEAPISPTSVSHVFHSSGTSGFPKPIPNTHSRSVSVLPRRPLPSYIHVQRNTNDTTTSPCPESAAFTTTPLFHGGVSDLLRAWMARSMIYFYPTSDVPITTGNVVSAVHSCKAPSLRLAGDHTWDDKQAAEREKRFKVSAFLSVPYILSTLAEDLDGQGVDLLRGMELVSTGGAPLETAIGDAMVERGVKLVSRLGSSECGFLLSSHRDYETEKDWELLRNDSPYASALRFENHAEGDKYEMVVTAQWSSLTKSNRDDGSYATGDLYEKHPTKPDVWRYVGRGDDVIVMSNGEKASPGPIEAILRASPDLSDALVVGSDRAQLGLLVFPRHSGVDAKEMLDKLSPLLQKANQASASFAQIARDMCLVIDDPERAAALPKSSKGTVQRISAYDIYRSEIDSLYTQSTDAGPSPTSAKDLDSIRDCVRDAVFAITGDRRNGQENLDITTDLFAWGVDSLMASRIRVALQKTLYVGPTPLPRNVVFEQPSIQRFLFSSSCRSDIPLTIRLSEYVHDRQQGVEEVDAKGEAIRLMQTLVRRYADFDSPALSTFTPTTAPCPVDVLLTGGTGALGSHLIHRLTLDRPDAKIICLVRAQDDAAARKRLLDGLAGRGLDVDTARLQVLSANVAKPHFGLPEGIHSKLVEQVGAVIHAAWPVHFASSLVSFEDQIRGTRNLIDFVRSSPHSKSTFHFCSSIASVVGGPGTQREVLEEPTIDPATASPIGYSQSKWVVERICQEATSLSSMVGRVRVLRLGQLCGDTKTGYWNEKEGWPLLIRTCQTTGCLPDLSEEPSWLPVDIAAQTIVEILNLESAQLVYHVLHPLLVQWQTVLAGLTEAGLDFETVESERWVERVEASIDADDQDPSAGMLSMWRAAYGTSGRGLSPAPTVSTVEAQRASPALRDAVPIRSADVTKMVEAWRKTGFLR